MAVEMSVDLNLMKPRILLGFASYGPYHLARLMACRKVLKDYEVIGWELTSKQAEYGWYHAGMDEVLSATNEPLESVGAIKWGWLVWQHLQMLDPAVCVVAGYSHPGMLASLLWCNLHGRPVVIMSDSKADDAPRRPLIEWCKRMLLRLYSSALVAGQPHRDYFIQLGFPCHRIRTGYDVVDNAAYALRQPKPAKVDGPYFLVVSRFIPKKNLAGILDAYAHYLQACGKNRPWSLVICGDGPLRQALEGQIKALGLNDHVLLPGFLQMEGLLPYFCHAKVFVHASLQEQWGLVVNEAMAAGLPVIVSKTCGCFSDLVRPGMNGFGFDPASPAQLADLMMRMHEMPEDERKRMGESGLRWINEHYSLEHFAQSLGACIRQATDS